MQTGVSETVGGTGVTFIDGVAERDTETRASSRRASTH
jgi:hypothetical protein